MKIVSISSGKGGVGKTTVTCSLALAIAELNKRVVIIDGDLGLANVDIHFGVRPQAHLGDVLKGQPMQQCITPILKNIDLIAGGSGLTELTHLNAFQRRELIAQVQDMQFNYDYAIIDNSSGIYEHVLHLNAIADDCLVVLTQDPSSFADAYSLIKVLNQKYKLQNFKIVCNQIKNQNGQNVFIKFAEVVEKFLSVRLNFLGSLPYDENLYRAQQMQRLMLRQKIASPTSEVFRAMAIEITRDSQFDNYSGPTKGLEAIFKPATGHA